MFRKAQGARKELRVKDKRARLVIKHVLVVCRVAPSHSTYSNKHGPITVLLIRHQARQSWKPLSQGVSGCWGSLSTEVHTKKGLSATSCIDWWDSAQTGLKGFFLCGWKSVIVSLFFVCLLYWSIISPIIMLPCPKRT